MGGESFDYGTVLGIANGTAKISDHFGRYKLKHF